MKTTIVENNKLIAEFMDNIDKLRHDNTFKTPYSYHESFDRLMPVVEKIEQLGYRIDLLSTKNYSRFEVSIIGKKPPLISIFMRGVPKIECVNAGVISFIEWYNENREKE